MLLIVIAAACKSFEINSAKQFAMVYASQKIGIANTTFDECFMSLGHCQYLQQWSSHMN